MDRSVPRSGDGTVLAENGLCATSHPLAAEAGLALLRQGGTAADAAVGMAAALTVVEPTSNGIGGDAFSLVWDGESLHGLNGSGRAPAGLTPEALRAAGHDAMPARGWWPVTVPGAPMAWRDLHRRFGRLSFASVLEPAVSLAESGHPVAPVVAGYWQRAHAVYSACAGPAFAGWSRTFAPGGRAPEAGETVRLPGHAQTLSRIANTDAEALYRGDLAASIDAFARETGGVLRREDLAAHASEWVTPLSVRYRDAELFELPPNGQGIVALIALGILDGLSAGTAWDDPEAVHASIEAVKLAFADAQVHVGDPDHMTAPPPAFLEGGYLEERRVAVGDRAERRAAGFPGKGGTVYLAAADAGGMMVSFIQSNYMGFGSGVVVPGTGIALQNRGLGFSLEPGRADTLAPGRRPFHTIIPGFLFRNGKPWGPVGVMGGHMQPQGHVQVVRALVDFGMSPQAALDLPRWRWEEGLRVEVEPEFPEAILEALRARGHQATRAADAGPFGRGQVILRGETEYAGGSDRRADGRVAAY